MNSQKTTLPLIFLFPLLVVLLLLSALHTPINAAPDGTITVNTLADDESDGCGTNNCTLREAIADAVTGDVINFSTSGTIDISGNGQLIIDKDLTINGGNTIIVSGRNSTRVFKVIGSDVTLDSLTITNGYDQSTDCYGTSCGGGVSIQGSGVIVTISNSVITGSVAARGGGIHNGGNYSNDSKLIVNDSLISGNSTLMDSTFLGGGGIYNNTGTITINNSIISNNSAIASGGGIHSMGGYGSTVEINDSTIIDNVASSYGGGIYVDSSTISITNSTLANNSAVYGGGISNLGGIFIIDNTTFSGNIVSYLGGAVYNSGRVALSNSVISGSSAGQGGCFFSHVSNSSFDAIAINNSTLSNNTAYEGGCIYNAGGRVIIDNSTISENWGRSNSGGIRNNSLIIIDNSTISGNSAGSYGGGGINNGGTAMISNSTITNNRVEALGGGINSDGDGYGDMVITNTIVSGNIISTTMMPDDLVLDGSGIDSFVSGGYNLIGTIGVSITAFVDGVNGDQTGVNNPRLGSLADNGGSVTSSGQATFTHMLLSDSPAIDRGANCGVADQRGVFRPQDGDGDTIAICDVGAFEQDIIFTKFVFLPVILK